MDQQTILSADYLDIIFDKRNKSYGCYELRKHYKARASKALLFVLLIISSLAAILFFHKEKVVLTIPLHHSVILADITTTPIVPKIIDIHPPVMQRSDAAKLTIPKIEEDDQVRPENAIPVIKDMINKQPDITETSGGETDNSSRKAGTGTEKLIEKPSVIAVVKFAEVMPQFDGEINKYLQTHLKYPALAKENNIEGKVVVEFIVNENGFVHNAAIKKGIGGGCDEEALRVINAMPRWKPGRQNNKAVKVYLLLPIVFQLQ